MTGLGSFAYQAPLLILAIGGLTVLLLDAFAHGPGRRWLMWPSAAIALLALVSAVLLYRDLGASAGPAHARLLMNGMLVVDRYALFFTCVFAAGAVLALLASGDWLVAHGVDYGEYYALLLFATAGMVMLAMAADLVALFLGVETMSLAVYVLTGSFRRSKRSAEAAMKYFLTGAFATAFLLYGIALVYGMTGTTSLAGIRAAAAGVSSQPLFLIGELMLIVALGFKVAAVPFHMWAPDAYEGAPTPVTAFMAAGVKAAGFTAVLRLFLTAFGGDVLPFGRMGWGSILAVLAAATMTLGNIAALRQENVKRLLAYTFTTIGAFGVVAWIGSRNDERLLVDDWAGLAARHPGAALGMTVFLLSLGGMPPTAGFFGKFYVFRAAMQTYDDQLLWLVVVGVLNSVVSVAYYLRIVMAMYFREPTRELAPLGRPAVALNLALVVCALFVLEMGLLPGYWLSLAGSSVMSELTGLP